MSSTKFFLLDSEEDEADESIATEIDNLFDSNPLFCDTPYYDSPSLLSSSPSLDSSSLLNSWPTSASLASQCNTPCSSPILEKELGESNKAKNGNHDTAGGGSIMVIYPAYSNESIQEMLDALESRTTDYTQLNDFDHFRDRSSIIKFALAHAAVLLVAPSGYGKTCILSMLEHFYDTRYANDYEDNFHMKAVDNYGLKHNCHLVLRFNFGDLDYSSPTFNLKDAIYATLDDFVKERGLLEGNANVQYREDSMIRTLDHILFSLSRKPGERLVVLVDDYDLPYWVANDDKCEDERREHLMTVFQEFYEAVSYWTMQEMISLLWLTGQTELLLPKGYVTPKNITKAPYSDGICGYSQREVRVLGDYLNWRFHSLGLDDSGEEFLNSKEAQEELSTSDYPHFGYSCMTVFSFFRRRLQEAQKRVNGYVPELLVPLGEYRRLC